MIFNNKLLFSLLFSGNFCGGGQGLDGGDKVVIGDPPSPPPLGKTLYSNRPFVGALSTQNDRKPEVAPHSSNFKILFYVLFKSIFKVCFLLEWCFIISVEVCSDHFQLKCTGFAGSH